jgi:protein-S-isoprenylcysteine O-methyltransferase Ste14
MSEQPPQPFRGPQTDAAPEDAERTARMANRFDIRRIIGAVFVLYGVILVVVGVVGSHAVKTKAVGVNINLWTGLAMLVFGVLMFAWALWRPAVDTGRGSGRLRRAPS